MPMKRNFLFATLPAALFLWPAMLAAQVGTPDSQVFAEEGRAPYRAEFISYDIRGEVEKESAHSALSTAKDPREGSKYFRPLTFKIDHATDLYSLYKTTVEIPALWLDRDVYVRDTGRTGRYTLLVNGEEAAMNTDSYGTNEYHITPYLFEGTNSLALVFTDDVPGGEMERFEIDRGRAELKNLYLFSQPRIHVFDYTAVGRFDEEFRDMVIDLSVVVVNSYNTGQKVTLGFDMWDPTGKLREYTFREVSIPGRGCDTVRFVSKVTGTSGFRYSAANPALYRLILSLEQEGRKIEYVPFRFAFAGDKPAQIVTAEVDFATSPAAPFSAPKGAVEKLRALKKSGKNSVQATRPQQKWFYDACEELGLWVVDCAAVECDPRGGDRGPDGTAANKPELLPRFLDRQQAMFFRNRNRPNIAGWSIGAPSGNGYNMYKSYQFLKSLDPERPVIYTGAEGEWNTDRLDPDDLPGGGSDRSGRSGKTRGQR